MKKFEKPLVANFTRTEEGVFAIEDLSIEELDVYLDLVVKTVRDRYESINRISKRKKDV